MKNITKTLTVISLSVLMLFCLACKNEQLLVYYKPVPTASTEVMEKIQEEIPEISVERGDERCYLTEEDATTVFMLIRKAEDKTGYIGDLVDSPTICELYLGKNKLSYFGEGFNDTTNIRSLKLNSGQTKELESVLSKYVDLSEDYYTEAGMPTAIEYEYKYYKTTGWSEENPIVRFIGDSDSLTQFMNKYGEDLFTNDYEDITISGTDYRDLIWQQYSDDFFKENNLIIVADTEPSGSIETELTEFNIQNGNLLNVYFERILPCFGDEIMACHIYFIEFKKDVIPEGFEDINVYFNDTQIFE